MKARERAKYLWKLFWLVILAFLMVMPFILALLNLKMLWWQQLGCGIFLLAVSFGFIAYWRDFFFFYLGRAVSGLVLLYIAAILSTCAHVPDSSSEPQAAPKSDPSAAEPQAAPKSDPSAAEPQVAPKSDPSVAEPQAAPKSDPSVAEPQAAPHPGPSVAEPQAAPHPGPSVAEPQAAPKSDPSAAEPQAAPKSDPSAAEPQAAPKPASASSSVSLATLTALKTFGKSTTPGIVLVLFVATVTILGFTITITRLHESHVRISSYEEFLLRLTRLLELTLFSHATYWKLTNYIVLKWGQLLGRDGPDREGLKILCTVLSLGSMSRPDLFLGRVYPLLKKVSEDRTLKVEIVCIKASLPNGIELAHIKSADGADFYEHEDFESDSPENKKRDDVLKYSDVGRFFHKTFSKSPSGRGFPTHKIRKGVVEAIDIYQRFRRYHGHRNDLKTYPWEEATDSPPIHLFWTRTRAIVAVPLDRGISPTSQQENRIKVIGYETTDPQFIDQLLEVYDEWKTSKPLSPDGASTPTDSITGTAETAEPMTALST